MMRNFKKLSVWEKSHQLTLYMYKYTSSYPKEELYGLVSQMCRSASSVPSNIAEGSGQSTQPQFARFLDITFGSASELEYQIILSKNLKFIDQTKFDKPIKSITEVKRMLASLFKKVRANG